MKKKSICNLKFAICHLPLPSKARLILIYGIRLYQLFGSILPPSCRFSPTCSEYAIQALQHYSFWRGIFLSLKRLLRCHPFNPGGYDPVT
ncbi:MAG: membrane protein insertion efficiency factor YidD [Candidatus Edwardsbacteria bacterium]